MAPGFFSPEQHRIVFRAAFASREEIIEKKIKATQSVSLSLSERRRQDTTVYPQSLRELDLCLLACWLAVARKFSPLKCVIAFAAVFLQLLYVSRWPSSQQAAVAGATQKTCFLYKLLEKLMLNSRRRKRVVVALPLVSAAFFLTFHYFPFFLH